VEERIFDSIFPLKQQNFIFAKFHEKNIFWRNKERNLVFFRPIATDNSPDNSPDDFSDEASKAPMRLR
jgi:hypothetical protein